MSDFSKSKNCGRLRGLFKGLSSGALVLLCTSKDRAGHLFGSGLAKTPVETRILQDVSF